MLLLVFPIYPQMWVRGLIIAGWLLTCYAGFRAIQSRRRWYRDNRHTLNAKSYTVEEAQAHERQELLRMAADMGLPAERLGEMGDEFRRKLDSDVGPVRVQTPTRIRGSHA